MAWNQQPYNPSWSQPPSAGPGYSRGPTAGPGYSQPHNPGYSHPPPTQSLPGAGGYSYHPPPPPTHSIPAQSGRGVYGGYPPTHVDPELWGWFQSVDTDHSGQITAIELQQALLNANWSHFNAETCRLLIGMFDANQDGTIDVHEFAALWKYVQEWKGCFDRFDKDRSGNIDGLELQQALKSFGYNLSMQFCDLCTRVFDRSDKKTMKFDDFIQCCVMLRSLTESFKRVDTNRSGVITISYEQFLEMALENSVV